MSRQERQVMVRDSTSLPSESFAMVTSTIRVTLFQNFPTQKDKWAYLLLQMGNKLKDHNSVALNVNTQTIVIHHSYKMSLQIGSIQTFPHGMDGLRLWEAGIILARYIIHNSPLFKDKRVLQLGAGVGIAGLTVKKWTECRQIYMTDYHPEVINNIKKNMHKNDSYCPVFNLDWKKHSSFSEQYDVIMGSDIVYFGCPVEDLYQVFKSMLGQKGIGIIVIPVRKNYAQMFVNLVQKDRFQIQIQKLQDQQYFQSALQNSVEGFKKYSLLRQIKFQVYKLIRKIK